MNRDVVEGVSVGDLVFLGSALLSALVVSFVVRVIFRMIKGRMRRENPDSIRANLIDDVDGALSLQIILVGLYVGIIWQPSLSDYQSIITNVYAIISVLVLIYGAIRVQDDAIRWSLGRVGVGTRQERVMESLAPMAIQLARFFTVAMGFLIILDQLGISIAPLLAGLGIGGLAVALALQGTLTNMFAGLSVMTDGSIRVGDYVELDSGMIGRIDAIGWRTTRIRLLSDNTVIIPNSKLADNVATNYNHPYEEMSVYLQVGVSYFSDLEHVERVTVEVGKQVLADTPGAVKEYDASIWYTELGDSNINFWVVLRSDNYVDSWLIKHNFIKALFRRYEEEGIEISFPARNVFMREGALDAKPDGATQ